MPFSDPEARLRRVAAQITDAEHEVTVIRDRRGKIRQDLAIMRSGFGGLSAVLSGQVQGCASQGFPGASVAVKDHASGVTLGTATVDSSGNYTIAVSLTTDPQNLDVVATATGTYAARFGGPTTQNVPTAHVGANTVTTIVIPPASGWCCGTVDYFPGLCTWTFNITGCNNAAVAGATVSISAGSCTTGDGTGGTVLGQCKLTVASGTYTVTVTPPSGSGYATNSSSHSFVGNTTTGISLVPDSSHVCVPACNNPIPKTLFFTDGEGTHQLDWLTSNTWSCVYTHSAAAYNLFCNPVTTMSVNVLFTLASTPSMEIDWTVQFCSTPPPPPGSAGYVYYGYSGGGSATSNSTGGSLTCSPFSATINMPTAWVAHGGDPGPPGGYLDGGGEVTPGGGGTLTVTP